MIPVIAIVGRPDSGKTTIIEKLVAELKKENFKVAVIKHTHHDITWDKQKTDTYRHKKAGAAAVCLVGPKNFMVSSDEEISLGKILRLFDNFDLIILEGYKKENIPKIEVVRSEIAKEPLLPVESLSAIVSDLPLNVDIPYFHFDDVKGLFIFIKQDFLQGV